MRSFPSCWNKTLTQLGFKRKRKSWRKDSMRRRALFESLEPRQMLAANTFTVDVLADQDDGAANGMSLRDALSAAASNGNTEQDRIEFAPGLFNSVPAKILLGDADGSGTIEAGETPAQLVIDSNVEIVGPGADWLTIDGSDSTRVFDVDSGVTASISDLLITGGYTTIHGAGIYNEGHLTLVRVVVADNHSDQHGGGIYTPTGSSVQIDQSTFEGNSAAWSGGGVLIDTVGSGDSSITNSTWINNSANNSGAVHVSNLTAADTLHISNSTFSGNSSNLHGGAIRAQNLAQVELINSTVTNNTAGNTGGGLYRTGTASFVVHNSILVGNTATGDPMRDDADGVFDSASSYNLVGNANSGSELLDASDNNQEGIAVQQIALAPLNDYGGPAKTHALLPNSIAIDAGKDNLAGTIDQRGFTRPINDSNVTDGPGGYSDIGAYEAQESLFEVDTLIDENDGDYSPGDRSLREAIALAKAVPGADTIEFDPTIFSTSQTITLDHALGELHIDDTDAVDIIGPGADLLTIDADRDSAAPGEAHRVMRVDAGVTAEISGVTITGGLLTASGSGGGGIYNEGDITLRDVVVRDNHVNYQGGGIYSTGGSLSLIDSEVSENSATNLTDGKGGGIRSLDSLLQITGSAITGNSSGHSGGGVSADTSLGAEVFILDTTVSHNSTEGAGGGIAQLLGSLTVQGSTVGDNTAATSGGGIRNNLGSLYLIDSTLSNNTASVKGGGIRINGDQSATVEVVGSTISHNRVEHETVDVFGGGIHLEPNGSDAVSLSIDNSTISNNFSSHQGGGIYMSHLGNGGSVAATLINSTLTENKTLNSGAGIYASTPNDPVLVHNTILAGNTSGSGIPDFVGGMDDSSSYNLLGNSVADPGGGGNVILNVGQQLGLSQLGNYGGPMQTHVPLPGSPAIDAGSNAEASGLPTDQRGFERIEDGPDQDDLVTTPTVDIGAIEASPLVARADFNGDSRADTAHFDSLTRSLYVILGDDHAPGSGVWTQLGPAASWTDFHAGDFNGDGRDDMIVRNASTNEWTLAVSDGTQFVVHAPFGAAAWTETHVGDFDGDDAVELLGWNDSTQLWNILQFDKQNGFTIEATWGDALHGVGIIQVGDTNRDGRDDLVAYSGSNWHVSLSQETTGQSGQFSAQQNWGDWFGTYIPGAPVDTDAPIQNLIEIFSEVYNTVELELYPGLMKGIEATDQTRAGNPWDQAALLVGRLEMAGFDADIASGRVVAPGEELNKWLGTETTVAAFNIIVQSMDGLATLNAGADTVEFTHAWVRARVPSATGLDWVDLDPSWKFREQLTGIDISSLNDGLGIFDELDYLSLEADNTQLPLEFFEDEVMQYLVENHPGSSLADVSSSGPILQQQFDAIPVGLGADVTTVGTIDTYANFDQIKDDSELAHRVNLSAERVTSLSNADRQVDFSQHSIQSYNGLDTPNGPAAKSYTLDSVSDFQSYNGLPDYGPLPDPYQIPLSQHTATDFVPYAFGGDPAPNGYEYDVNLINETLDPYLPFDEPPTYTVDLSSWISPVQPYFHANAQFDGQNETLTLTTTFAGGAYVGAISIPPYEITPDTKVSLDFSSTNGGRVHGFGLGNGWFLTQSNQQFYRFWAPNGGPSTLNGTTLPNLVDAWISYYSAGDPAVRATFDIGQAWHADPDLGTDMVNTLFFFMEGEEFTHGDGFSDSVFSNVTFHEPNPFGGPLPIGVSNEVALVGKQAKRLEVLANSPYGNVANYALTKNTILEFDFASTTAGRIHAIGWDVDDSLNSPNGDSSHIYQVFGSDTSTFPDQQFNTYSPSSVDPFNPTFEPFTIPIGEGLSIADNEVLNLKNLVFINEADYVPPGPGPYPPPGYPSPQESYFNNIKLYEPPYGNVELTTDGDNDVAVKVKGTALKVLNINPGYPITADTVLRFTFKSEVESLSHFIGWDTNNNYQADNIPNVKSEALFGIYGSQLSPPGVHDFYTTPNQEQTLTIPIGGLTNGAGDNYIGQTINYLVLGVDDGLSFSEAESIFSDIEIFENRPPGAFNVVGNEIQLDGTIAKITVSPGPANNSRVLADSWLKFTFRSDTQGTQHSIGLDTNATFGESGDAAEAFLVYGEDITSNPPNSYGIYTGSGSDQNIAVPVGGLIASGNNSPPLDTIFHRMFFTTDTDDPNIVAESVFKDVVLWRPTSDNANVLSNSSVELTGTSYKTIDIGNYFITPNTYLTFDFDSSQEGLLHGIGLDIDDDGKDGDGVLWQLYGTQNVLFPNDPLPAQLSTAFNNFSGTPRSYSIRVADYYSGNAQRIVLFNKNGPLSEDTNSVFSNIKLHEEIGQTGTLWNETISVPEHSLDPILFGLDYASPVRSTSYLAVGDTWYPSEFGNIWGDAGDKVQITVDHLTPTKFGFNPPSKNPFVYRQEYNEPMALGLDANQHSRDSLTKMQESLLAGLDNHTTEISYFDDINTLLSYTVAKYWHDFNRGNGAIEDLTNTIGYQQYVGSGVASAKQVLLRESPSDPNDFLIDHLPYKIAPLDMGIDLPNATHNLADRGSGVTNGEAFQLVGFNSSGLEHNAVEEQINSKSISTVKGLLQAMQDTGQHLLVFLSSAVGGVREIEYAGDWNLVNGEPVVTPVGTAIGSSSDISTILSGYGSEYSSFVDSIYPQLDRDVQQGTIRIVVPSSPTILEEWEGAVYAVEKASSLGFKIQKKGEAEAHGADSTNVYRLLNESLPTTTFKNQTFAGDPVNVANGNMFRDDVDIVFPNLGVPLDFVRHYDSQSKDDIGMGVGWTYRFGDVLFLDPEDVSQEDLIWLTSSGQRHTFEKNGSVYDVPAALHGTFEKIGSTFYYKDKSGLEHHFEEVSGTQNGLEVRGRLVKQVDSIGNGVNIVYDAGTLRDMESVRDVHNFLRRLEFDYDAPGGIITRVHKVDGSILGTWDYTYQQFTGTAANSDQRLTAAIAPQVNVVDAAGMETPDNPTVAYSYYGSGVSHGVMETITEPTGETHTYEYYPNGRVFRVADDSGGTQTFNYNLFRNLTEFTDERGNTEIYIHQDNGLLNRQIHPDRTRQQFTWAVEDSLEEFLMTSSTDEVGAIETFTYYDSPAEFRYRELKESTAKHNVDAQGVPINPSEVLTTEFDYFGDTDFPSQTHIIRLAETVVDPGGEDITTSFTYDSVGRLLTTTDALGNVASRTYYADGSNFSDGLLESETGPKGTTGGEAVTWRVLDEGFVVTGDKLSVRLLAETGPNNDVAADAIRLDRIDPDGLVQTIIIDDDASGNDPRFQLNLDPNDDGTTWQSGGNAQPMYEFDTTVLRGGSLGADSATWLFSDLEPGTYRVSTTWVFDSLRDSTATYEVFDGAVGQGTPTLFVVNQQVAPDAEGTFYESYRTVFDYDAAGNLTSATTEMMPAATTVYDSSGNPFKVTDATGIAVESQYDVLGRLESTGLADPDGSSSLTALLSTFSYDASGRVRFSTDPLGRTTELVYDAKGNLIQQISADGTSVSFKVDAVGNRTSETDELGRTTRFVYDDRHRLIQTIHPDGASERVRYTGVGQVAAAIDALQNETTFTYDAAGRLTSTTNAENNVAANEYDLLGRLSASVDFKGQRTEFKYDDLGRVIETRVLPNTAGEPLVALSTVDYDAAGNVVRHAFYDTVGMNLDVASVPADPRDLLTLANLQANLGQIVEIRYDSLNRPVEVIEADGTEFRTTTGTIYDGAGRVLLQSDELGRKTEFRYGPYGRLSESVVPGAVTRFEYDAAGNQTAVIDPNGNRTEFDYDVFNRVTTTTDALGGQEHAIYDVAGQLVATVDALGRAAYTLYDQRGRAKKIRSADPDPDGPQRAAETEFEYDAAGNLIRQTDPRGFETRFEYDALNRLIREEYTESVVVDDSEAGFSITAGTGSVVSGESGFAGSYTTVSPNAGDRGRVQWDFNELPAGTYRIATTWDETAATSDSGIIRVFVDGVSQFLQYNVDQTQPADDFYRLDDGVLKGWEDVDDGNSPLLEITGSGLHSLQLRHSGSIDKLLVADAVRLERVVSREFAYDANGNLVQQTDALGRVTDTTYDELDRVKTVTLPDPDGAAGPLPRPLTTTFYDGYGNVIGTVEDRGGGANERTTEWTYDHQNRVLTETLDAGGNEQVETAFEYDAVGNLTRQIEAAGELDVVTEFEYTDRNLLSRELRYRSSTDAKPLETLFYYDANGNVTETIDSVYHPTEFAIKQHVRTWFTYDAVNRQTSVTSDALGPLESISRAEYDAVGNVTSEIDPLGRTTRHEYDRLNRLVKTTDPDPDGPGPFETSATRLAYDVMGNLVAQTNGENEIETFAYDRFGQLVRSTDGLGYETRFTYDEAGNRTSTTDPTGNTTRYAYDDLGRLTAEMITLGGADVSRTYQYDAQGNLEEIVDRNGRQRTFAYDRLDRRSSEAWLDAGSPVHELRWFYDELGRVLSHQDDGPGYTDVEAFQYDHLGRVTRQLSLDSESSLPFVEQRWEYDVLAYGDFSQYVRTNYSQHTTSDLTNYTDLGDSTLFTDTLGRLGKIVDRANAGNGITDKVVVFDYDQADQLTGITRTADAGNFGFDTDYAYDAAGRVAKISHLRPLTSGPSFTSYSYAYDQAYRITDLTTAHDTTIAALSAAPASEVEFFTFDDAGQLTADGTDTFVYDENGNRTTGTVLGEHNRLLEDADYTYEYDNEGNLTRRTSKAGGPLGGPITDYHWDHRNRLVEVIHYDAVGGTPVTETIGYHYNADDQLVHKSTSIAMSGVTVSSSFEDHVYDGNQQALTFDDTEELERRYTWGPGTDQLLVDEVFDSAGQLSDTLWAATDHLGSVGQLLDNTAEVVEHREYSSFGELDAIYDQLGNAISPAQMLSDVAYTGKAYDANTGLYNYSSRWYNPATGRFVSEDPIGEGSNWYLYVLNDPINFRDPTGLSQAGHPFSSVTLAGLANGGFSGNVLAPPPRVPTGSFHGPVNTRVNTSNLVTNTVANSSSTQQFQNQITQLSQQTAGLRSQLSHAHQTLAGRSFFEAFDKRSDRAQIATLQTQLDRALGERAVAFDNLNAARNSLISGAPQQTFAYDANGTQFVSELAAAGSGLRTGGKAVVNSAVSAGTLGFVNEAIAVTDFDRSIGYNASRLIGGVSSELLVGLATGGASRYGRAGKAALVSRAALVADTTSNAVNVGRGVTDAYNNGLSVGNSLQIVGGAAGLIGNTAGLREAVIRNRIDDYIRGLPSRSTPTNSAANLFEIRQTGPVNYTARGGGATVEIDGFSYRHRAITEAKFVGSPARSPYVPGSAIPEFIRAEILTKTRKQFNRLATVVADPSVPLNSVRVVTNTNASQGFFRGLINEVGIPGQVVRR